MSKKPEAQAPELSDAEKREAEKEGLKQAYAESAATNFRTQSETVGEPQADRWPDRHEIMQWSHLVDLGLDAFKDAIKPDAEPLVPEGKVAGLMELERSGKNRTEYVKALCDRLGVSSPLEVTSAGPGHTNDVTAVNPIKRG
ncbi:hypothetical protein [Pseudorhodoferax sp. Leaf274]|uniref:hypothetical protein n=1 Tax=Pseudorhodoferax sp. Leaf274 TaxID=1736318 RepID=UPI000702846F|nr:hypothetical protein [Pseudorhodoferax sp. Leaf274]KQP36130.1 hypothetical protein ASF44_16310 [Pseudorhodoferax sp. Leaf274]